jgi:alkaline phosphatase D
VFDTIYQEWVNRTDLYDPSTGKGSIAVEFAGTAVSSLSSYGANLTTEEYLEKAERHVKQNPNLAWAEGDHRGYFILDIKHDQLDAHFYGMVNNRVSDSPQILLSSFNVKRGANKLTRPINGGNKAVSGAIQDQIVDYQKQRWNGTTFE